MLGQTDSRIEVLARLAYDWPAVKRQARMSPRTETGGPTVTARRVWVPMLIAGLGLALAVTGALAIAPMAAQAQQAARKVYRIGYLDPFPLSFGRADSLNRALGELGWFEKRDHVFEARFADRKPERFADFAVTPAAGNPRHRLTGAATARKARAVTWHTAV